LASNVGYTTLSYASLINYYNKDHRYGNCMIERHQRRWHFDWWHKSFSVNLAHMWLFNL